MGYVLALIGMGLMVGMAGAGSAIGLVAGGSATVGMLKKKPEAFGSGLVLSGLPATQGLYGFVGFIMYQGLISPDLTLFQGSVVLGAGIAIALAAFISAVFQGRVCANGIAAIGQGHNVFANTMILAAFPEFYAILALVAAILLQGLMQ
ncbi:V-type ATP synthase subunit K [Chitinispirillum alkaliphilum]|nr:V-type ATP synthase subunit K [Chitinispirillum alkaliphilum]